MPKAAHLLAARAPPPHAGRRQLHDEALEGMEGIRGVL